MKSYVRMKSICASKGNLDQTVSLLSRQREVCSDECCLIATALKPFLTTWLLPPNSMSTNSYIWSVIDQNKTLGEHIGS